MYLSNRLKMLRTKQNLSQRQMAEILGLETSSYGKYENSKAQPPADKLQALAEFFDVSVDYLLGRTNVRKLNLPENVQVLQMAEEIDELSETQQQQLRDFLDYIKSKNQ